MVYWYYTSWEGYTCTQLDKVQVVRNMEEIEYEGAWVEHPCEADYGERGRTEELDEEGLKRYCTFMVECCGEYGDTVLDFVKRGEREWEG